MSPRLLLYAENLIVMAKSNSLCKKTVKWKVEIEKGMKVNTR